MSLGINLLVERAKKATALLSNDFDIEIKKLFDLNLMIRQMLKGVFLLSPEFVLNHNWVKSNNKIGNSKKYLIFLHNMVLLIYE